MPLFKNFAAVARASHNIVTWSWWFWTWNGIYKNKPKSIEKQIHLCQLILWLCWSERKTSHQLKFAMFSWQKFASFLYHDMALPSCNTVYHIHITIQSLIMTARRKIITSDALKKDFASINDIFKIQYFVGPMISYIKFMLPCFNSFFWYSGR